MRTLPACSALQLPFELVQELPVSTLRDDLLRARLDDAALAQAQVGIAMGTGADVAMEELVLSVEKIEYTLI